MINQSEAKQRLWNLIGAAVADDREALQALTDDLSRALLVGLVGTLADFAAWSLTRTATAERVEQIVRGRAIRAAIQAAWDREAPVKRPTVPPGQSPVQDRASDLASDGLQASEGGQ
jgi:hypothetical protein